MPGPNWLDRLRAELEHRGLPAGSVERLLEELRDHAEDAAGEGGEMNTDVLEQRLGRPEDLAGLAAEQHARTTWVGRHPVLTFVAGPVVGVAAAAAACVLALAGCVTLAEAAGLFPAGAGDRPRLDHSPLELGAMALVFHAVRLVPFTAAAAFFAWLAVRRGHGLGWALASCATVVVLASSFHGEMRWPTPWERGSIAVGAGWPLRPSFSQLAVPLLAAALVVSRGRRAAAATA